MCKKKNEVRNTKEKGKYRKGRKGRQEIKR